MYILSGKYFYIFVSVLLLVAGVIFFSKKIEINNAPSLNSVTTLNDSAESKPTKKLSDNKEISENITKLKEKVDNPQKMEVIAKWLASRNYPYFQGQDEYESYNLETAKKLAKDGDIRAMLRVANIIQKENGPMAGVPIYTEAAAYGSTWAISSIIRAIKAEQYLPAQTEDEKKAVFTEIAAWAKVAVMRGDAFPLNDQARLLAHIDHIDFTDADQAIADKRSEELYAMLQKRRTELGLGEFDNSIPDEVREFFYREEQSSARLQNTKSN